MSARWKKKLLADYAAAEKQQHPAQSDPSLQQTQHAAAGNATTQVRRPPRRP